MTVTVEQLEALADACEARAATLEREYGTLPEHRVERLEYLRHRIRQEQEAATRLRSQARDMS